MVPASAPLAAFARERAELIEHATPGLAATEELARLTDEAVAVLHATASSAVDRPFSVLALGGYGSGRLYPQSDIDLLIVGDLETAEFETLTRILVYPLWDLGLEVGHQVRTPREHLRAVKDDLTILTASLTARHLAGDAMLSGRVTADVRSWARRKRRRLTEALVGRRREGSPYSLYADLKTDPGGQRDLDELTWLDVLARAAGDAGRLETLARVGLLSPDEGTLLDLAERAIARSRWVIGARMGDARNRFTPDAEALVGLDAQAVQTARADIHHVLLTVRARMSESVVPSDEPWSAERLLAAVASGPDALDEIERAAWAGSLDELLPGFSALLTLRRPALSHRWTVGAHSLHAAVAATRTDDEFTSGVLATLPDTTPLIVAILAHDVGKRDVVAGHALAGEAYARDTARRFGLTRPLAWGVATLVREHLLLAETVAGQDLGNEDVILRAAARIGDRSLVGPLYLLTRADMLATGPGVWSPWQAALMRDLTGKLDAALSDDVDGAGIASAAARVRDRALEEATRVGLEEPVVRFVQEAPLRYLAGRGPKEVLRHARLARELRESRGHDSVAMDVTGEAAPQTWRVSIMTRDRDGLFAMIAGVLALADLTILAAEAFTETSGIALDVFTVAAASGAPVGPDRWARVERLLRAAVADRCDVEGRLRERRRHYPVASGASDVRVEAPGALATIVRVRTPDRVGLLHDLASTIHAHGLDIRLATARTDDGVASDVFHVIDEQGAPVQAGPALESLRHSLAAAATRDD